MSGTMLPGVLLAMNNVIFSVTAGSLPRYWILKEMGSADFQRTYLQQAASGYAVATVVTIAAAAVVFKVRPVFDERFLKRLAFLFTLAGWLASALVAVHQGAATCIPVVAFLLSAAVFGSLSALTAAASAPLAFEIFGLSDGA